MTPVSIEQLRATLRQKYRMDKELSLMTMNTNQSDKDLAALKQSIDNHWKLIEAAAKIEVQERKEAVDKDCLFKVNAKACATILRFGVEE
jgi:hypothetical protein